MNWITTAFIFLFGKFNWESVLEVVLRFGLKQVSTWVSKKDLSLRAKMFVRVLYLLAGELGVQWAADTKFIHIDDALVDEVTNTAEVIATAHNFPLPEIKL